MARIGFIGASGLMGHGMAKNLLAKGHAVALTVHRNRERVADLLAAGAGEAAHAKALAEASEIIFLCVTGSPQVEACLLGEQGVLAGARPGLLVVDCSTSEPDSTAGLRARCEAAPHLLRHGPGFVLYALMDVIVDRYFPVLDTLEEEVDRLEEVIFSPAVSPDVAERIYDLKWDAIALKRAVSPMIDVCNRLTRHDQGLIADECRPYFRDVYDHVVRINESVDTVRELLTSALEANLSLTSIRQNEVMKTLAGWAAIFGAVTVLAGIWGMNFEVMPELHRWWGYPAGLGLMGAVAATMYWRLKRAGWL